MNITDVQITKFKTGEGLKAIAAVVIDNAFVVHDIKIIEAKKGLFIKMPERKCTDGNYRDVAHPINHATRKMLEDIILTKYGEVIAK